MWQAAKIITVNIPLSFKTAEDKGIPNGSLGYPVPNERSQKRKEKIRGPCPPGLSPGSGTVHCR